MLQVCFGIGISGGELQNIVQHLLSPFPDRLILAHRWNVQMPSMDHLRSLPNYNPTLGFCMGLRHDLFILAWLSVVGLRISDDRTYCSVHLDASQQGRQVARPLYSAPR